MIHDRATELLHLLTPLLALPETNETNFTSDQTQQTRSCGVSDASAPCLDKPALKRQARGLSFGRMQILIKDDR